MTDEQTKLLRAIRSPDGFVTQEGEAATAHSPCPPLSKLTREWESGLQEDTLAHLEGCSRCRSVLKALARREHSPPLPHSALCGVCVAGEPLKRIAPGATGMAVGGQACNRFEADPALVASLTLAGGKHHLALTHAWLRPATLVRICLEGGDRAAWSRFAVMRPAFTEGAPSVAWACVEESLQAPGPRTLEVDYYSPSGPLEPEDATALRDAYQAMLREDPLAAPFWGQWASDFLDAGKQPEAIRAVLQEVKGEQEGVGIQADPPSPETSQPGRGKWQWLPHVGIAVAAALLVGVGFWLGRVVPGPGTGDGELLASLQPMPPEFRAGEPPVLTWEDGRWRLKPGTPLFMEIQSPRDGRATVVIVSDHGNAVYPRPGRQSIRASAGTRLRYGPINLPEKTRKLTALVIVTPDDRSEEVRSWLAEAGRVADPDNALDALKRHLLRSGAVWVAANSAVVEVEH